MNIIFVLTWPENWKHVGLMVSTVIVSGINNISYGMALHARIGAPRWSKLASTYAGVLAASLLMGVVVWEIHAWLTAWLLAYDPLLRVIHTLAAGHSSVHHAISVKLVPVLALSGAMLAGGVIYIAFIYLFCRSALREVAADFRHRKQK